MRIEELNPQQAITLLVQIGDEEISLETTIQKTIPQKHLALAAPIYHENKVVTFKGNHLIVNVIVIPEDNKLQIFKNVGISLVKLADGTLCYTIATLSESKPYNRRGSFRCFLGLPTSVQVAPNQPAYDAIIKDISYDGFAVICPACVKYDIGAEIHILLRDFISETSESYNFYLHGTVKRTLEMEGERVLYGCQLNNTLIGLEKYIMKKERLRLKNCNGGNL